jgi:hypothetical protein
VAIIGVVVTKILARKNPAAAFSVAAVALLAVAALWGASSLYRWVSRDAAAPRPSPAVAAFKLVLGLVLFLIFFVGAQADLHVGYRNDGFPIDMLRLGVLPNVPFGGWTPVAYGLAAALSGFGILAGVLGLIGRRATWLMRLALLTLLTITAAVLPALCPVRMMILPLVRGDKHASALAFNPDGTRLAVAGRGEAAWDQESGIAVYDTSTGQEAYRCVEKVPATAVAFSPDGQTLISAHWEWASSSKPGIVRFWDAHDGARKPMPDISGMYLALSLKGNYLATADEKTVTLYEAATGSRLRSFDCPHKIFCLAFNPDGSRLAVGGGDDPGRISVWDPEAGRQVADLSGHEREVWSLAYSADGRRLASASGSSGRGAESFHFFGDVKVWDAASGKELLTVGAGEDTYDSVAFYPDNKHVAAAIHQETRMWDVDSQKLVLTLFGEDDSGRANVTFSRDGKHAAWGGLRVYIGEFRSPP